MWTLFIIIELVAYLLPIAAVAGVIYYFARKQGGTGGGGDGGLDWFAQLNQLLTANDPYVQAMRDIQRIIDEAQRHQLEQQASGTGSSPGPQQVPPALQAQFQAQMFQAQQRMQHMNQMARERLDLSRASMLSQASSYGIDVSGW